MGVRFVHVGLGHLVQADRVQAVIKPHSACGRRYTRNARSGDHYIDATMGRSLKSQLLLDDGSVLGSAITSTTLQKRLNGEDQSTTLEEGDEADSESD